MRTERIVFALIAVLLAVGINQYLGFPLSLRGPDLTEGQIKIAYATCAQEMGLPLKNFGYPPIEGAPVETLNMKQRDILLGCALGSGSYNFVNWALQKPPQGQMFSLDQRMGNSWPVALVAQWRNGRAAADTLYLILKSNDKVWPVNTSASLMVALYEAETVDAADYLATLYPYLLVEDNRLMFDRDDYPKYKGLTLAQYHAYMGRVKVAEYYASKKSRLAIPGKHFRHWLYENEQDKKVLYDARLDDLLERYGAARDDRDALGRTVLFLAVAKHDEKYVEWLLQQGANPNIADAGGETPLHVAARDNQRVIATDLLEHAADPNLRDHQGETPLHTALRSGAWDAAAALLDKHARVGIPDNLGRVAAFDCVSKGCLLLDRLSAAGADFSVLDKNGNSLLHVAASVAGMSEDTVKLLIAHGAPVNSKNIEGMTALHIAAGLDNLPLTRLLLSKGAKVDEQDNLGDTPLHLAHTAEIAEALLDAGADPDIPNKAGMMPVNGTVARTQMLFHSPAQARATDDTLPRYFSGIKAGGAAQNGLTLTTLREGVIDNLVRGGDGSLSTGTVNFMPRSAALEFRVQQACEAGAELEREDGVLELPHLGIYASWHDLNPVAGMPTAYSASIQSGECGSIPVTEEKVMENVRRIQPDDAGSWRTAAMTCAPGRAQMHCRIFFRPALRILVKSGGSWREAGILHAGR